MFQRIPIPTLPGRPTRGGSAAVAIAPETPEASTGEVGAWFLDDRGRLYLENPITAGLFARYESIEAYNERRSLPEYIRTTAKGTPVRIDMRTLKATR